MINRDLDVYIALNSMQLEVLHDRVGKCRKQKDTNQIPPLISHHL